MGFPMYSVPDGMSTILRADKWVDQELSSLGLFLLKTATPLITPGTNRGWKGVFLNRQCSTLLTTALRKQQKVKVEL